MNAVRLVVPSREFLSGYVDALQRGWSPDNMRPQAAQEHLAAIEKDADAFVAGLVDRDAKGPPITLPDGSRVNRLPGYTHWIWDGEYCGSINFRWQKGTEELPPTCLGHIGYAVVPWKQRQGCGTAALRALLPMARVEGLAFVIITTDPENIGSQKVIEANGGRLIERFTREPQYGNTPGLRYRIDLIG